MKITDKRFVLRRIDAVRKEVAREIAGNCGDAGLYARGFSREGFAGGYLMALDDVAAALTHGYPSDHRKYWQAADTRTKQGDVK